MNKINTFVLRVRASSLKFVLRLLGLSSFGLLVSCTNYAKYGSPIAEYGAPYPDNPINFHGKVISEDSLKPITGIDVKIYSDYNDTVYDKTTTAGNYSVYKYAFENQKVKLVFSDKDSVQNGKFIDKTIDVDVSFRDVNNLEHEANITLQRKP